MEAQNIMAQLSTHLSQQHHPFPIRPDDVVHLGTDPLPGQLRHAQAGLQEEEEQAGGRAGGGRGWRQGRRHSRSCQRSPHRSRCWSGPCCTRCSCSSSGPGAPWSPHSCSLQAQRAQLIPQQWELKLSAFSFPELESEKLSLGNIRSASLG